MAKKNEETVAGGRRLRRPRKQISVEMTEAPGWLDDDGVGAGDRSFIAVDVAGSRMVGHSHKKARVESEVGLRATAMEAWIEHGGEQGLASHGAADDGRDIVGARDDLEQEIQRKRRRLPWFHIHRRSAVHEGKPQPHFPLANEIHIVELLYMHCKK